MNEYLLSIDSHNFSSLTIIRQYFGEKIAFLFAWRSFITCLYFFIAIPGLALQIYIIITGKYSHWLLPIWVFYSTILNTVIVELWKRKRCEINYRWGSLDELNKDK